MPIITGIARENELPLNLRRFAVMFFYLWILFGLFLLNECILSAKEGSTSHLRASQ
jgi:hypothetical protein